MRRRGYALLSRLRHDIVGRRDTDQGERHHYFTRATYHAPMPNGFEWPWSEQLRMARRRKAKASRAARKRNRGTR